MPASHHRPPARPGKRPSATIRPKDDIHPIWLLVSTIPIFLLGCVGILSYLQTRWQTRNEERKLELLKETTGWVPPVVEDAGKGEESQGRAGAKVEPPKAGLRSRKAQVAAPKPTNVPPTKPRPLIVGFWHPYCDAGGGGERVLWTAIAWTQATRPKGSVVCVVYTGDYPGASKEEILERVKSRFSLEISPSSLHLVPLPSRHLISDTHWPRFTLLFQSLSSIYLAYQSFCSGSPSSIWPDIYIDTMGYAFTLPFLTWLSGGRTAVGAYVHYPTVSTDMVDRVKGRMVSVENGTAVAGSWFKTAGKVLYYRIFIHLYAFCLLFSSYTMTNSSWTQAHVTSLLSLGRKSPVSTFMTFDDDVDRTTSSSSKDKEEDIANEKLGLAKATKRAVPPVDLNCKVVYPPCDTREFLKCGNLEGRERVVISLAQFRPEKDHAKQLRALHHLFVQHPEYKVGDKSVKLVLMGGARNSGDEGRVKGLRELAKELDIQDQVEIIVNAPFPELVRRLGSASIGINTMQDEHFGINIVEFMAAGLISLVHASAGPLLDIVVPFNGDRTGYNAKTAEEFGDRLYEIFELDRADQLQMRRAARGAAKGKFSQEGFEAGWKDAWDGLVTLHAKLTAMP